MAARATTHAAPVGKGAAPTPASILLAALRGQPEELRALCAHPATDWARVAEDAAAHRVGPLLLDALQRGGAVAAGLAPPEALAALRAQRRALAALAVRLDASLDAVLSALAAAGAPVIVLKGLTLARYYPSPLLRPRSDLDLLVPPEHWPLAERVFEGLGFTLLDAAHVRRPRLSAVQAPEDRQYRRAGDGLLIELHADHLSAGLLRREDAAVWRRACTVTAGDHHLPALAPGDAFLQIATHLERHAYTRLLWFYDLYLLVRAEGRAIAWREVARRAERAGVAVAAYAALSYTEDLLGPVAPPEARAALRLAWPRRRLHEALWQRRRILALDTRLIGLLDAELQAGVTKTLPLPPTTFDPYAPLGAMALHLLLSGNIGPKARLLGRRFLPAEEWLRYYGPANVGYYRSRLLLARLASRRRMGE